MLPIEIRDGEDLLGTLQCRKERGGNDVDACKGSQTMLLGVGTEWCQCLLQFFVGGAYLACLDILPSHEAPGGIEHQIARCIALANQERGISLALLMAAIECCKVGIGEDVYIVYQYGAVGIKEGQGLAYATTCIKQLSAFVGEGNVKPKTFVGTHILDNLFGIVMYVDDYAAKTCLAQP